VHAGSMGAESLAVMAREQAREIAEFCRQHAAGGSASNVSVASLSAADLCALVAVRMKKLVPHDALAVYLPRQDALAAELAVGDNYRLFSSLQIPLGEGLAGWVAQNHKAIVNGNPSVEPGYASDPAQHTTLRSALAAPVEGAGGIAAVLALYRSAQDAFTKDDLQVVEAICDEIGAAFEGTRPKTLAAAAR